MKYLQQFVTTSLNVGGGIDASQTTGIVLQSLNNVDATKPSVACISWADPLSTSVAEWVTYTSINSTTNTLQGVTRGAEGYSAKTHSNGATIAFPLSKAHVNEVNDSVDKGWVIVNETFTYASATTITVASGATARFQKGDKLKLTQTTDKYFYVVGVASTLLTITGGSDYALASAAITSPYLSRIENPFGFPQWFNYTPIIANFTLGGGTLAGSFTIQGLICDTRGLIVCAADSAFGNSMTISAPFTLNGTTANNGTTPLGGVTFLDSGTAFYSGAIYYSSTSVVIPKVLQADATYVKATTTTATVPFTAAVNDRLDWQYSYRI